MGGGDGDGHQGQQDHDPQQGRHHQQHDHDGDEQANAGDEAGKTALHQAFQDVDVGRHAGQQLARAFGLEKSQRLSQQGG